jgi:hypothetical protein
VEEEEEEKEEAAELLEKDESEMDSATKFPNRESPPPWASPPCWIRQAEREFPPQSNPTGVETERIDTPPPHLAAEEGEGEDWGGEDTTESEKALLCTPMQTLGSPSGEEDAPPQ